MIKTPEELTFSQRRLKELQARYSRILADSHKEWRAKEMELAGVRGIMEEVEAEMITYIRLQLQQLVASIPATAFSQLALTPNQTLEGLDTVAEGLRLASSARSPA